MKTGKSLAASSSEKMLPGIDKNSQISVTILWRKDALSQKPSQGPAGLPVTSQVFSSQFWRRAALAEAAKVEDFQTNGNL